MIIIEFHKKINTINQNIYSSVISSLDFSSVHCPKCNESGLKVHAYYYRAFKNSSIRITRLICPHCGSTHAVLLSPMIPFISSVSYDDMISIIVHKNTDAEIDNSLISFFQITIISVCSIPEISFYLSLPHMICLLFLPFHLFLNHKEDFHYGKH